MRKTTLFRMIITLLCIIILVSIIHELSPIKDTLIMAFQGSLHMDMLKSIRNYAEINQYVLHVSLHSFAGGNLSKPGRIMEDITVVGVYHSSPTILGTLAAIHSDAIFLPLDLSRPAKADYTVLWKFKEDIASIASKSAANDMKNMLGAEVKIDDTNRHSRRALQKIYLIFCLMISMILYYAFKAFLPFFKKNYRLIKEDTGNYYLPQLLRQHYRRIFLLLLAASSLTAVAIALVGFMKFDYIVDPSLIPSRLIDTKEAFKKLRDYLIEANTRQKVFSFQGSLAGHANAVINYIALILIPVFWRLTHSTYYLFHPLDIAALYPTNSNKKQPL